MKLRGGRHFSSIAASLVLLLCTGGCTSWRDYFHNGFKVGPNYCRPAAPVAEDWIDAADVRLSAESPDCRQWWTVFQDPVLDQLVAIASQQSITLREAGFRIAEAQTQRAVTVGSLFPQSQEVLGEFAQTQRSQNTATFARPTDVTQGRGGLRQFSNYRLGATLAWELDFWGRFRRAVEAADARLDSSIEDYDDVLVLLIAETAATYVELRTVEQRLAYARSNAEMQAESTRIAQARLELGTINSELDAPQAKSNLARTLAAIEQLEIAHRQAQNRLAVLLGMPPHDLGYLLGESVPVPAAPQEIVVGIPAELLRRRPDVRRAERLAAAQNAEIGFAQAALYPRFSINGMMLLEAAEFGDVFDARSWGGTIGPGFRWNVLNYGRLLHNVQVQDARFQQQVAAFQQTVLEANEEAENAIVAFLNYHEQIGLLEESVREAQEAVRVAQAKYRSGQVDFNRVFTVEQLLVGQQDQLATAQGNLADSLIQLYRALGGGWEIRLAPSGE